MQQPIARSRTLRVAIAVAFSAPLIADPPALQTAIGEPDEVLLPLVIR